MWNGQSLEGLEGRTRKVNPGGRPRQVDLRRAAQGFNTGGRLVAWNTTVAAAAGGFGSYLYLYGFRLNLDVGFLCNGVLSGLVSITACCDVSTPLTAMLIGLLAGLIVYPMASNGMRRLRGAVAPVAPGVGGGATVPRLVLMNG
eukprot:Skav204705  [mRNA]  locus=scaffold1632:50735:63515:+ [translate_table: standard]